METNDACGIVEYYRHGIQNIRCANKPIRTEFLSLISGLSLSRQTICFGYDFRKTVKKERGAWE